MTHTLKPIAILTSAGMAAFPKAHIALDRHFRELDVDVYDLPASQWFVFDDCDIPPPSGVPTGPAHVAGV